MVTFSSIYTILLIAQLVMTWLCSKPTKAIKYKHDWHIITSTQNKKAKI